MKIWSLSLLSLLFACSVTKNAKTINPYEGDAIGCGNFIVYKLTPSNDEYISISFNASEVELVGSQSYGIGKTDILKVERKKFAGPMNQLLCNDVMEGRPKKIFDEVATSGTVDINLNEVALEQAKDNKGYKVTVILRNVEFEGLTLDYLKLENVYVGWLPG